LRVTLGRLDGWNERRRELAAAYATAGISEVAAMPHPRDGEEPVHHLFVTRTEEPDALAARLAQAGVAARSYYRVPVHRQPAMAQWAPTSDLPGTERAAVTNLALPMGPTLGPAAAGAVAEALSVARR
jgi:dTDP-4-amino-4,6-dideoxygalactose transaminase